MCYLRAQVFSGANRLVSQPLYLYIFSATRIRTLLCHPVSPAGKCPAVASCRSSGAGANYLKRDQQTFVDSRALAEM